MEAERTLDYESPALDVTSAPSLAQRTAGSVVWLMANTVVTGGLILATFLTLFIIPTFYFVIERWVERRARASDAQAATVSG